MEKIFFDGTLMVPVKNLHAQCNFVWVGDLVCVDTRVHIILFKADDKKDFVPLMEADLKTLKEMPQDETISSQVQWIELMLTRMQDSVWVKKPEDSLLRATEQFINRNVQRIVDPVQAEKTIYLSGVSAIV